MKKIIFAVLILTMAVFLNALPSEARGGQPIVHKAKK